MAVRRLLSDAWFCPCTHGAYGNRYSFVALWSLRSKQPLVSRAVKRQEVNVSLVAFIVAIGTAVVGLPVELHVVSSLKDFRPSAYVSSGEPTCSNLLSRYS